MNRIQGIGFDLFNTLITIDPEAVDDAFGKLIRSLGKSGFKLDRETFRQTYRQEARHFFKAAHESGKETYNRFWIGAALNRLGYDVLPDDSRIEAAVDDYFSSFSAYCRPIPGVFDMLKPLRSRYRLGLLSNFTHAPTVRNVLDHLELSPFFEVILISADLGYRKPHPLVFKELAGHLDLAPQQIMYIGDDLEPDVYGARAAGLHPVWMTHVRDEKARPAEGGPAPDDREIDPAIPRISSWKELLPLLNR